MPIRFERIDDDGRFCVLRVSMPPLTADELLLRVASASGEHGFVQVDAAFDDDEEHADFLLPSRLLAGGAFALDVGGRLLRLPPPTDHPVYRSAAGALVEHAQLAQQEQLADQSRRIAALRAELRRAREREFSLRDRLEESGAVDAPPPVEREKPPATTVAPSAAAGDGVPSKRSRRTLIPGEQGARVLALNMALQGTPREETAEYLAANFEIADRERLLDEVYGSAGG